MVQWGRQEHHLKYGHMDHAFLGRAMQLTEENASLKWAYRQGFTTVLGQGFLNYRPGLKNPALETMLNSKSTCVQRCTSDSKVKVQFASLWHARCVAEALQEACATPLVRALPSVLGSPASFSLFPSLLLQLAYLASEGCQLQGDS